MVGSTSATAGYTDRLTMPGIVPHPLAGPQRPRRAADQDLACHAVTSRRRKLTLATVRAIAE
jgi:hypothetical protein